MNRPLAVLSTLLLLGSACTAAPSGSSGGRDGESAPPRYEDENQAAGVDVAAAQAARKGRQGEEKVVKSDRESVSFGALRIDPEEPTVVSTLRSSVEFRHSSDSYADYDITWFVNDVERVGIRSETLNAKSGRFKKGDVVRFSVSTLTPDGSLLKADSKKVFIGNATPEIVSRAASGRGIDGLSLEAKDADGDSVTWAIKDGPPGVTISADGRVRVSQVDLAEDYDGEVVISATDPGGASAELHVPVKINAAVAEVKAERTITRAHTRQTMTADEFEKANLDNLNKVENMSVDEFEAYTKQQEEAEEKRRKQKEAEEERRK